MNIGTRDAGQICRTYKGASMDRLGLYVYVADV